jgi:hypothetical protein
MGNGLINQKRFKINQPTNMQKPHLITFAEYNIWANAIVINWLQQITDEHWHATVISSFDRGVLHDVAF